MSNKEMICIVCPMGCRMTVEMAGGDFTAVHGNSCPKGAAYAEDEICRPRRTLPTTVKILNAPLCRLPVRTASPIPKSKIMDCMNAIMSVEISAPIKVGDVVIHDILGTGVDVIASRSMPANIHSYGDAPTLYESRHCSR